MAHSHCCCCEHEHTHGHDHDHDHDDDEKELFSEKLRLIISIILLAAGLLIPHALVSKILYLAAYVCAGYEVVFSAVKNIFKGRLFDESFLMAIATIGAVAIGEYFEAAAVMVFYCAGEYLTDLASDRSRDAVKALVDITPKTAFLKNGDSLVEVDASTLNVDDIIIVRPGEKIACDGIVTDGSSDIDTSALTGESMPRSVSAGSEVFSGSINKSGALTISVTKEFSDSVASQILRLVEEASEKKAHSEKFITRFARIYTPCVVAAAFLIALIPGIINPANFPSYIHKALTLLVVSCPCALVISVPLSFFCGIGAASKKGILVKGSSALDTLSNIRAICFDKTGTLTKGQFTVSHVSGDPDSLLPAAKAAEMRSTHPAAIAVVEYCKDIVPINTSSVEEVSGMGVCAQTDNGLLLAGNEKLMKKYDISFTPSDQSGTHVYVALDTSFLGCITVSDTEKAEAKDTLSALKKSVHTVMLTGDTNDAAKSIAAKINVDEYHASLLPSDKVEAVLDIKNKFGTTAFVGDGINDSPVIAASDVGFAMGALGSDAAIEASDIVIMNDDISLVVTAMNLARKTVRVVKQNITFALAVKLAVMLINIFVVPNMLMAVFADVGVALLCVLNAVRLLRNK